MSDESTVMRGGLKLHRQALQGRQGKEKLYREEYNYKNKSKT
jgi:hypothetical protein